MTEEEIIAYVHIPVFYNAKIKTENITNTIQETKNIEQNDIPIPLGALIILLGIFILLFFIFGGKLSE